MSVQSPVITFAMPRSGSTLLIRLLNRCKDSNGKIIRYNGECDVLHHITAMHRKFVHQDIHGVVSREELTEDKKFLSHYHHLSTEHILGFISQIMHVYCGASSTWGWKNVNYGHDKSQFIEMLATTIAMYPDVRFVFLTRDYSDCLQSVIQCGYWEELGVEEIAKRLSAQEQNYHAALQLWKSRSCLINYSHLLSYNDFSQKLSSLGFEIEQEDYNSIIKRKMVSCLEDATNNDQETRCSR